MSIRCAISWQRSASARAAIRPVYQDGAFVPRLILPIALSYDHRVIDGAAGARFTSTLRSVLTDIRQMLL